MELGLISLLPPLLAIFLAIFSRQVYLSLAAGLWLGYSILSGGNPAAGLRETVEALVAVLGSAGDARVVIFTLVVGALIAVLEKGNGVKGFIDWVEHKRWVNSEKSCQWLAWLLGLVIFIESNITMLVAGAVSRPLFDRFKVSREKLAYIVDSTSAPVCILIPLNAWGAFNVGLLQNLGDTSALQTFINAIAYNFYAYGAVLLVAVSIFFGFDFDSMRKAQRRTQDGQVLWPGATPLVEPEVLAAAEEGPRPRARNMVIPIVAMIMMMPLGLYITGDGDLSAGSGSTSILWASLFGVAVAWIMLLTQRAMSLNDLMRHSLQGAGGLLPVALVLVLALALGDLTDSMGTGAYVAGAVGDFLPRPALLPVIFLVAGAMSFSIGSSWGTFAIMVPIAVPMAVALELPVAPFLAAVLSGGIFGDHASPISDTTVVASMASATDHIDHVRTQMPYALCMGGLSALAFFVVGLSL